VDPGLLALGRWMDLAARALELTAAHRVVLDRAVLRESGWRGGVRERALARAEPRVRAAAGHLRRADLAADSAAGGGDRAAAVGAARRVRAGAAGIAAGCDRAGA